jgi:hypothetical protein
MSSASARTAINVRQTGSAGRDFRTRHANTFREFIDAEPSVKFGAASAGFQFQPRSRNAERSTPGGAYHPPEP